MFKSRILEMILTVGDVITGGTFVKALRFNRNCLKGSIEQQKSNQQAQLGKTLTHAARNVPYFIKQLNTNVSSNLSILQFPLMDKVIVQQSLETLLTNKVKGLVKLFTSGSSGTRGFVFLNKKELSNNRALQILWWEWAGYKFGDRVLQLGFDNKRSFIKRIKDYLLSTDYYFAKNLNEEKILQILCRYKSKKNVVFFGYAAYLNWFAEVALKNNLKLNCFKTVISCGDKLFPHYRLQIMEAFGVKTFDTYGASEGFLIAGERSCGKMHTFPQHAYIEILDDFGKPQPNGSLGHVYATSLTTHTLPLIRYKLGDLAAISGFENCSCGVSTPVISNLIGRDTDVIRGPEEGVFTVQDLVYALKQVNQLEGYQLIVLDGNNRFRLEYWPAHIPDIEFITLKNMLKEKLKTDIHIIYTGLEAPKPFTGKVQLITRHNAIQ